MPVLPGQGPYFEEQTFRSLQINTEFFLLTKAQDVAGFSPRMPPAIHLKTGRFKASLVDLSRVIVVMSLS